MKKTIVTITFTALVVAGTFCAWALRCHEIAQRNAKIAIGFMALNKADYVNISFGFFKHDGQSYVAIWSLVRVETGLMESNCVFRVHGYKLEPVHDYHFENPILFVGKQKIGKAYQVLDHITMMP